MGFRTLYACDPDKSPNCKKTMCYMRVPKVYTERCYATLDPKRALLDEKGEPIVAFRIPRKDDEDGDQDAGRAD